MSSSPSKKKLLKENGQRSAFTIKYNTYQQYPNCFGSNLITPEKTKEIQKFNQIRKIEDFSRTNNFLNQNKNYHAQLNIQNATTIDKTKR